MDDSLIDAHIFVPYDLSFCLKLRQAGMSLNGFAIVRMMYVVFIVVLGALGFLIFSYAYIAFL